MAQVPWDNPLTIYGIRPSLTPGIGAPTVGSYTYCGIFRPQSVGYLPVLGVSPAHLLWGPTIATAASRVLHYHRQPVPRDGARAAPARP